MASGARWSTSARRGCPLSWHSALQWCKVLPDLAVLQHLARGGEPAAWMHDDTAWRELCGSAAVGARRGARRQGRSRRWPLPGRHRNPSLAPGVTNGSAVCRSRRVLTATCCSSWCACCSTIARLFVAASPSEGWLLRGALRARLTLLFRRAALQPALAFIDLALCALDLERLRAELLRRLLFPRWQVA